MPLDPVDRLLEDRLDAWGRARLNDAPAPAPAEFFSAVRSRGRIALFRNLGLGLAAAAVVAFGALGLWRSVSSSAPTPVPTPHHGTDLIAARGFDNTPPTLGTLSIVNRNADPEALRLPEPARGTPFRPEPGDPIRSSDSLNAKITRGLMEP